MSETVSKLDKLLTTRKKLKKEIFCVDIGCNRGIKLLNSRIGNGIVPLFIKRIENRTFFYMLNKGIKFTQIDFFVSGPVYKFKKPPFIWKNTNLDQPFPLVFKIPSLFSLTIKLFIKNLSNVDVLPLDLRERVYSLRGKYLNELKLNKHTTNPLYLSAIPPDLEKIWESFNVNFIPNIITVRGKLKMVYPYDNYDFDAWLLDTVEFPKESRHNPFTDLILDRAWRVVLENPEFAFNKGRHNPYI